MSLPNGYKRLEYIKSSGTQYIDTGFKPNQNTRVVMDVTPVDVILEKTWCAFGVRQNDIYFGLYKASTRNMNLTWFYGSNYSNYFTVDYAKRHNLEVNKNAASVDGISKSYAAQTFQFTIPLFLLCDNAAGSPTSAGAALLYSCQIYDNGTLIRDFIPCKNASGVIGLWDDVNSVFYGNAGTGTFTAGPEIKGANKTLIDGTGYDVQAGKCLVDGTAYAVKKGRTLIGGTGYDIKLKSGYTLNISIDGNSGYAMTITIEGVYTKSLSQYEGLEATITDIPEGTKITVSLYGKVGNNTTTYYVNGVGVGEDGITASITKDGSFTCVYKTDPTFGIGAYVFELNC